MSQCLIPLYWYHTAYYTNFSAPVVGVWYVWYCVLLQYQSAAVQHHMLLYLTISNLHIWYPALVFMGNLIDSNFHIWKFCIYNDLQYQNAQTFRKCLGSATLDKLFSYALGSFFTKCGLIVPGQTLTEGLAKVLQSLAGRAGNPSTPGIWTWRGFF